MSAVPMRPSGRPDFTTGAVVGDAVRLAAEICEAPYALVGLIHEHRVDVVAVLAPGPIELAPDHPVLARLRRNPEGVLVVPDASLDPELVGSPLPAGVSPLRFVAAALLTERGGGPEGLVLVGDWRPRLLEGAQAEALRALSRLVSAHLELEATVSRLESVAAERRRYEQHLEEYQIRLERNLAEILERSLTDPLTGLRNRRAFLDRLEQEISHTRHSGLPMAVVLIDVDGFKPFNDTFGHPAGDQVLHIIAQLFAERVRSTDVVSRIGGDEFALVLPNTDAEGGYVLAERLRRAVEEASWSERAVTVSAGVASASGNTAASEDLLAAADRALYSAKTAGRNRVGGDT